MKVRILNTETWGVLIEKGTYKQLMDVKGGDYNMFTSQAHWYQNSFVERKVEYSG